MHLTSISSVGRLLASSGGIRVAGEEQFCYVTPTMPGIHRSKQLRSCDMWHALCCMHVGQCILSRLLIGCWPRLRVVAVPQVGKRACNVQSDL